MRSVCHRRATARPSPSTSKGSVVQSHYAPLPSPSGSQRGLLQSRVGLWLRGSSRPLGERSHACHNLWKSQFSRSGAAPGSTRKSHVRARSGRCSSHAPIGPSESLRTPQAGRVLTSSLNSIHLGPQRRHASEEEFRARRQGRGRSRLGTDTSGALGARAS